MPRRSPAAKLVGEARASTGVALAAAKVTVPMLEPFFWTSSTVSAVAAILARHEGPVILAGDFNTWSTTRRRAVDAIALRLGLSAIPLEPDERSRFLGEPVDQMYYRGLVPSAATAVPVRISAAGAHSAR